MRQYPCNLISKKKQNELVDITVPDNQNVNRQRDNVFTFLLKEPVPSCSLELCKETKLQNNKDEGLN